MGVDDVVGVFKELTIALLVFLQCLLRLSVLGDVGCNTDDTNDIVSFVCQW